MSDLVPAVALPYADNTQLTYAPSDRIADLPAKYQDAAQAERS
jgi:hypothetical protein